METPSHRLSDKKRFSSTIADYNRFYRKVESQKKKPAEGKEEKNMVHEIDIDLNVAPASENQNLGLRLQKHSVVFEADANGDDGYDSSDLSDNKVNTDPNMDEV
ncbi:hypothetical protein J1N35_044400 [Gossypium stocksii]|uniref:Uncharacterized protein n=1 Tax=Gossypium stocksii TaxID=47602 RepID=A0A9D3ZFY6_9ROSI|nr:hypothetical protein J1N35_044400 [Gossypium stocksii]